MAMPSKLGVGNGKPKVAACGMYKFVGNAEINNFAHKAFFTYRSLYNSKETNRKPYFAYF
jgi:hypothetical protein